MSPILIFLSHSVADIDLVEAFETLLSKALNITSESIFCSSLEGQGVTKGANFVDAIKDKALEAKAVVALISPAYMESAFCLAELGAAWVLNTHRFPIVVPPNRFEVMQATLLGVVGVKIDQEEALTQLLEDIGEALSLPAPKAGVRARAMRDFVKALPELKESIGKAKHVDASIHNKTLADLKSSREAWEATEQELETAKAHIKVLKKTKDAKQVAAVSKAFEDSDWEMELDSAIGVISGLASEVGGGRVLRHMILELLGKPSHPDLNDDYIERAIEIDVYDSDSRAWIHSSDEMKALSKAMEKVEAVFEEHEDAASELKRRGKRHKTDDIRFWEQQVGL
ncbi:toll/interleukin-1 receptor domain-containing protein [Phyllobacterium endophyticum]|uniref:toll/interleukin-1 receptor domain-containing protein n=1 Tax=Phyllobacterium endophyticum TaxID=1149773 RepID=UPI0011D9D1E9|nr:toll/interleukin-1 receptor domain-containing protein [Phyllobacterium endophyticum]TXR49469.1 toll/interleukin-1 receptor domain-containing protein [Phyllobacterium endophyticum]